MTTYKYPGSSRSTTSTSAPVGITEFEILKASHKFLRDEDERPTTWDEKLAGKYYSNLYREFAVCDLKHYKSGNFALRWRTEEEVLDGSGETTCGNTRCEYHFPGRSRGGQGQGWDSKEDKGTDTNTNTPQLTTLELPFAYVEQGESRSALVKVVLCKRCVKRLMWKRTKEKQMEMEKAKEKEKEKEKVLDEDEDVHVKEELRSSDDGLDLAVKKTERKKKLKRSRGHDEEDESGASSRHRRRRSRSRSPHRRSKESSHAR